MRNEAPLVFLKHDLLKELQCFKFARNVPNVKFIVNHGLALIVQFLDSFAPTFAAGK